MERALTRALTLLIASSTIGTIASCSGVECGEGTFVLGDQCVGYDPNDTVAPTTMMSPSGGRTRDPLPELVELTTDEPATIYYTIDGTDPDPASTPGETSPVTIVGVTQGMQIKFMAVDRSGNQEAVQASTFDSDTTPPAVVSGLAISLTGTTATLTWTNPTDADYVGTMIARVDELVDGSPSPGMTYAAATALSPSVQILAVGSTTQLDDPGRVPGPVRYVAWTFDDLGNYSNPVAVTDEMPVGALSTQLSYDVDGATLTTVVPPDNLDVSGSTAAVVGTTLTLSLSLKNNTTKYFQNPKVEVVATTGATFSNSDGTADGYAFKSLGPTMLAPGATVTRDLVFTGVAAGTTPTFDLLVAQHPSMLSTSDKRLGQLGMIDLGSRAILPRLQMTARGPNDRIGGQTRPGTLVGGHFLDVPNSHGSIERFDLATGMRVGGVTIDGDDRVNVQTVFDTGAELIAVVKQGGHRRTGDLELVRLDQSLRVLERVTLPFILERGFTQPARSADGLTAAIPVTGGILLLDVASMTPIDPIPATEVVDLIDPRFASAGGGNSAGAVKGVAFFDNANGLVAITQSGHKVSIIKRTPDDYSTSIYQGPSTGRTYSVSTAPDGRVWFNFDGTNSVRAYDPSTDQVSTISYATANHGVNQVDGQMWIIRSDRRTLDQVSNTGAVQRTITLGTTQRAYGHWLTTAK